MHPDVATALRLQEIDTRIAALKKEIDTLPRQIAYIERQLEGHKRQLEVDKAALAANQRDRKRHEADIQTHQQKISKLRDQMLAAKTNDQYRAFQHEIEWGEAEIRKCEDHILDLMGESEPLEVNVKKAEAALKEETVLVERRKKLAQQASDKDRAELAQFQAQRQDASSQLPVPIRAEYERLLVKHKGGPALSEAVDGLCTVCQMAIRPQLWQDLKQGGEVFACESCKRLLYYVAPVQAENETA